MDRNLKGGHEGRGTGWGRGAIREVLTHRKEEMDERKITASKRNRGSFSQR